MGSPSDDATEEPSGMAAWLAEAGFSQEAAVSVCRGIDLEAIRKLADDLDLPLADRKRLLQAVGERGSVSEAPASRVVDWSEKPQAAVVRRQLTILFCDLVGSTDLAERLDPEDLIDAISSYRGVCKVALDRWEGRLSKFLGDGILALFGWPTAHEDDAERAVFAALEMVEAVNHLNASDGTPLSARVGIATGLVVIGDVGVDGLYERDCVVGAAPNLAARVQGFAQPGTVIIAPQTRRLIGERFILESVGMHALKGISEPVEMWKVAGIHREKNRFEAKAGGAVPLFGRERELSRLAELWECCARSQGKSVVITGEAGIGKSRLLQELRGHAAGAAHLAYQCFHYHANTALAPFIEKLHHEAGISRGSGAAERLEKLTGMVRGWAVGAEEAIPLMASLLSVPLAEGMDHLKLSPLRVRERTIELLIRQIEKSGAGRPLVLVFEDIHWADPSTIELLRTLTGRIAHLPILLVMTSREPMLEAEAEIMLLNRLDGGAVSQMLHHLAGDSRIQARTFESIARSAQGIPLFLEELAGGMEHSWNDDDESGNIPASLKDLLAARLDHLGEDREIVNMAATIGMAFSLDLLGLLLPTPAALLENRVRGLCENGILRAKAGPGGLEDFEFRHALVGETAYLAQLKADRRRLHRQIALTLESHFPHIAEHEPEKLGSHFVKARDSITGANYFQKAGLKALQSSATTEAIRNLKEGLLAIKTLPPSLERDRAKLRLQATLGTAYMQAKGWAAAEVEHAYAAAGSLSHAAGTTSEAVWILWGTTVYHEVRGRINEATAAAARVHRLAVESGEGNPLLVADMMGLQMHFYAGRFQEAVASNESFLARYDAALHRSLTESYSTDLQLVCYIHYALALWVTGNSALSLRYAKLTDELLAEIDHPYSVAWGHTWGSVLHLLRGDTARVAQSVAQGARIAQEQGFAYVTAMAHVFEGWVDAQNGQPDLGEQKMALGIQKFCSTGAEIAVPFFQTLRADALRACGKYGEGLRILDHASRQISLWGEAWQEPEVCRIRGNILAASHDPGAEVAFQHALSAATALHAPHWQMQAAQDYALHLQGRGDADGARRVLDPLAAVLRKMDPAPMDEALWPRDKGLEVEVDKAITAR